MEVHRIHAAQVVAVNGDGAAAGRNISRINTGDLGRIAIAVRLGIGLTEVVPCPYIDSTSTTGGCGGGVDKYVIITRLEYNSKGDALCIAASAQDEATGSKVSWIEHAVSPVLYRPVLSTVGVFFRYDGSIVAVTEGDSRNTCTAYATLATDIDLVAAADRSAWRLSIGIRIVDT